MAVEPTGERLIPEAYAGELVLAEHLARYRLAARLARGRRVLDAACGEGYGSAILAAAGAVSVCGVDIDAGVVKHAGRRYGLDFRVADLGATLPFADGELDLVVSFESIEHVANPIRVLDEFARVLTGDGLLLVSTPNPDEYLEGNPFHQRELSIEELRAALAERFAAVRLLHQQNFLTSAIHDPATPGDGEAAGAWPLDATYVPGLERDRPLYALALCGPDPLPELRADVAVLSGIYEAHALADRTRSWQERAGEAERVQREWEARARQAERNVQAWHARAVEAESIQREYAASLAETQATLARIAASWSWRITKPLRDLKRLGRR